MKKIFKTLSICLLVLFSSLTLVGCGDKDLNKFTIQLSVSNEEHGVVYGAGKYYEGQTITIVAEAKEGYKFESWSDGEIDAIRTITIDRDESLTANFERVEKVVVHRIGNSVGVSLWGNTNPEDVLYIGVKKLEFKDIATAYKYVDTSNYAPEMPLVYMDLSDFNGVGISNYQTVELVNQSDRPFIGPNAYVDEISFKVSIELQVVNHQGKNMVEHFVNKTIDVTIDTSNCTSIGSRGFSLIVFEDELWEGTSIMLTFNVETTEV